MLGSRPSPSFSSRFTSSLMLAHSVASHGPYALSSRSTFSLQAAATFRLHASPAAIKLRNCPIVRGSVVANSEGGTVTTLIAWRSISTLQSACGSGKHNVAPAHKVTNISDTDASKLSD